MKYFFKILTLVLLPLHLYSHSLLMNVMDNEDGTISIEGIFNTGESAAGAYVILRGVNNQETLFKKRLPDEGELSVAIPKVPYEIVLDGGAGHIVVKDGIAPKGGYVVVKEKQKVKPKKKQRGGRNSIMLSSSKAVNVSILVAFLLLFSILFIGIYNTNKILKAIKEQN